MNELILYLVNFDRDPGPGDFVFVAIWSVATLLLVAFYCYKMLQR